MFTQSYVNFIAGIANNGKHFIFDVEKMGDFIRLSPKEFLESYSYLTIEEYEDTVDLFLYIKDLVNAYDEKAKLEHPYTRDAEDYL